MMNFVSKDLHVFLLKEKSSFFFRGKRKMREEEREVDKKMNHNTEVGSVYSPYSFSHILVPGTEVAN